MSALAKLTALVGYTDSGYLDAHFDHDAGHDDIARTVHAEIRAEVLNEAADLIEAEQHRLDDAENAKHGALDRESELQHVAVHAMGALLRRVAEGAAPSGETTQTADFFQPGHTYSHGQDGYKAPEQTLIFRVEHVTRHPDKGHRRAIGWSRTGEPGARWHGDFRDEGEFEGWTETTDGGDA